MLKSVEAIAPIHGFALLMGEGNDNAAAFFCSGENQAENKSVPSMTTNIHGYTMPSHRKRLNQCEPCCDRCQQLLRQTNLLCITPLNRIFQRCFNAV